MLAYGTICCARYLLEQNLANLLRLRPIRAQNRSPFEPQRCQSLASCGRQKRQQADQMYFVYLVYLLCEVRIAR